MKNFMKPLLTFMAVGLLLCLGGCNKSESEYKLAITEHMRSEHGVQRIDSYNSFRINDNGSAAANVNVTVATVGDGSMDMRNDLTLDRDCKITSCGWCSLGL